MLFFTITTVNILNSFCQTIKFESAIGNEDAKEFILRWVHKTKIIGNNLVILDNQRVIVIDTSNNSVHKFGGFSSDKDNTMGITDVETDNNGNYLVTAQSYSGVKLFSKNGNFIKEITFNKVYKNESQFIPFCVTTKDNRYYMLDRSNRNIKMYDRKFNYIGLIGSPNSDKFGEFRRDNIEKYNVSELIESSSFVFDRNENIIVTDFKGCIKKYSKDGKFINCTTLPINYWAVAANDRNKNIYIANPETKEIYNYVNNTLIPTHKLNDIIKANPKFKYCNITDISVDDNNFYITFYHSTYLIGIFSKRNFSLKKVFSKILDSNYIEINKPTHIKANENGDIFIQEDYAGYKKVNYCNNKMYLETGRINRGCFDFINNNNILFSDYQSKSIQINDSTGKFKYIWGQENIFTNPIFIVCKSSNVIVVDRVKGYSKILHFTNEGKLIKSITKNGYNQDFLAYSADIDDNGNIYIPDGGRILVYNSLGKIVKEIGGYGTPIRPDLNLGLGVSQKEDKIALHLGGYEPNTLHFTSIYKIKIYNNLLYIADATKIVVADLKGNIIGYIGEKRGSKINEFNDISDFDICNDKIFIADTYNNRILIYTILF